MRVETEIEYRLRLHLGAGIARARGARGGVALYDPAHMHACTLEMDDARC